MDNYVMVYQDTVNGKTLFEQRYGDALAKRYNAKKSICGINVRHKKTYKDYVVEKDFDTIDAASEFAQQESLKRKYKYASVYNGDTFVCGYYLGKKMSQTNILQITNYDMSEFWYFYKHPDLRIKSMFARNKSSIITIDEDGTLRFEVQQLRMRFDAKGHPHVYEYRPSKLVVKQNGDIYELRRFGYKWHIRRAYNGDILYRMHILKINESVKRELIKIFVNNGRAFAYNKHSDPGELISRFIVAKRYPMLYGKQLYEGPKIPRNYSISEEMKTYIPEILNKNMELEETFIAEIINQYSLPKSKTWKKLYADNLNNLAKARMIQEIIDNNDLAMKLMLEEKHISNIDVLHQHINTVNKLKAYKTESWIVDNYLSFSSLFVDVLSMLEYFNDDQMRTVFSRRVSNIAQLHEVCRRLMVYARVPKQTIEYTKAENELCYSNNKYSLELPKTTHDLVDIGEQMGICVGGYGDMAVNKSCTICVVTSDNKYVACIELNENRCKQIKAKYNGMVCGDLADFIRDWIVEKQINTTCCSDYNHMDDPNYYPYGRHNFAVGGNPGIVEPPHGGRLDFDNLPF